MAVLRVKHQSNYVVILNNTVLADPNLSFKAKGIWAYCMSKPDDWEFYVSQIVKSSKEGEKSIYSGLKELEKHGYLKKIQSRDRGKFKEFHYVISEIKIILPQPEKGDAEKGDAEKEELLSIDSSVSIDKELNLVESSQVLADAENLRKISLEVNDVKAGSRSYEHLSEKEVLNIVETYSHEEICKAAANCSNRKKITRAKLGPIESEKAYFLDSLKKFKNGTYKL
jgi:hypothetical protein